MVTKAETASISTSESLFEKAQRHIPGGVNSPVRAFRSVGMTPLFISRAKGSHIFDADGNSYLDYVGSWGPMILGHADERVLEAVIRACRNGTSFGAPTESEITLAAKIKSAVPSVELIRFVNSGNEATQGALRVARGYTGRDKIVKFAGCYHGSVDPLLVKAGSGATTLGVPDSLGVPAAVVQDTLIAEFNDLQGVENLSLRNSGQIAAIILEVIPGNMGVIKPDADFLRGLRELCDREGIVLVFDEVMTGFRVAWGGAQSLFQVFPDISTFGKIIGGGFPVGAYGGKAEIMSQVAPLGGVYQAGTLSGNPVAMAAGITTLTILEKENPYPKLDERSRNLMDAFAAAARAGGKSLQTACYGGMMGFFFSEGTVRNYGHALASDNDSYIRFFRGMLNEGIYFAPSAYEAMFISTAHEEQDFERTVEAAQRVMATL